MDKIELFKLLLTKAAWETYKHRMDKEVFPEILHDLYDSLEETHTTTKGDVTCREIWYIHNIRFPTLTDANKNVIKDVLSKVDKAEVLSPDVIDQVVNRALVELKALRIAEAALNISKGNNEDFSEIQRLMDTDVTKEDVNLVNTDLSSLLDDVSKSYKWHFNIPELDKAVGPIGPQVFGVFAGPVNSGKSCMGISFTFGPNGFAEQGAKCVYIGNEEDMRRTVLRAYSSYTGMTRDEINKNPSEANKLFAKIKDNIYPIDDYSMTFSKLEHIIKKFSADIVLIDMLDKVKIGGTYAREDQRLAKIYETAREIAKKHNITVLGTSQTNGDTFGELIIEQNQLAGSRVDKTANVDLLLTLGSYPVQDEASANFRRIYVAKSKLGGNDARINCIIQPYLSRIVV